MIETTQIAQQSKLLPVTIDVKDTPNNHDNGGFNDVIYTHGIPDSAGPNDVTNTPNKSGIRLPVILHTANNDVPSDVVTITTPVGQASYRLGWLNLGWLIILPVISHLLV